jgi:putative membrane protein
MKTTLITAIAVVLQGAALAAIAQQPPDSQPDVSRGGVTEPGTARSTGVTRATTDRAEADRSMGSITTEDFVKKAAVDGMAEVELGKLAQQKSTNAEVRKFGAHMVKDHTAANEKLKAAASKANVQVPKAIDAEHQQAMASLQKLEGTKFDAAYSEHMQQDHAKAVALFQSASQSTQVAEPVRQFAQSTLPTLKEHHQEAEQLDSSAGSAAQH